MVEKEAIFFWKMQNIDLSGIDEVFTDDMSMIMSGLSTL